MGQFASRTEGEKIRGNQRKLLAASENVQTRLLGKGLKLETSRNGGG